MSSCQLQRINSTDVINKYTEGIDFSNACREFYMNRVKTTESFKKKMNANSENMETRKAEAVPRKKSSIESAMEKLRHEMVSLMDQDLCLMRQLLTLNEAIEDIKTKRLYGMSKNSLHVESQDLGDSDWSISDTDMYASEENFTKPLNDARPALTRTSTKSDIVIKESQSNSRLARPEILVNDQPIKCIHSVQRSIDSGYDGSDNYQTDIEVTL